MYSKKYNLAYLRFGDESQIFFMGIYKKNGGDSNHHQLYVTAYRFNVCNVVFTMLLDEELHNPRHSTLFQLACAVDIGSCYWLPIHISAPVVRVLMPVEGKLQDDRLHR